MRAASGQTLLKMLAGTLAYGAVLLCGTGLAHAQTANATAAPLAAPQSKSMRDALYALWARYYEIERSDPRAAEALLGKIIELSPTDPRAHKSLGYLRLNRGDKKGALAAFLKAEPHVKDDHQLTAQIAYLQAELGKEEKAYYRFRALSQSADEPMRRKACMSAHNLRGATYRHFYNPWFGDFAFDPSYEGRFDNFIFPAKARIGRSLDEKGLGLVYGFAKLGRDTRSTGGSTPDIFSENQLRLGLGWSLQVDEDLPIRVYAEAGRAYDLIDQGGNRWRNDLTLGITGFEQWGIHRADCVDDRDVPSYFADLYGNMAYYSAYGDNVIGQIRFRPGVNLIANETGLYGAYVKLQMIFDSEGLFYNNLFEVGPALIARLNTKIPITVRVEYVYGTYWRDGQSPMPFDKSYETFRVELNLYKFF